MAQEVVPNVNRLAQAVRVAGGSVIWLQMEAPPEKDDWSALRDRFSESAVEERWGKLGKSSRVFELWPELDVRGADLRIVKSRYSAFISGSSELDNVLKVRDIGTLLVARIPARSRLRLDISSSDFPQWDRNLNTGGTPLHEGPMEAVPATQTVLHTSVYPTRVRIPILTN